MTTTPLSTFTHLSYTNLTFHPLHTPFLNHTLLKSHPHLNLSSQIAYTTSTPTPFFHPLSKPYIHHILVTFTHPHTHHNLISLTPHTSTKHHHLIFSPPPYIHHILISPSTHTLPKPHPHLNHPLTPYLHHNLILATPVPYSTSSTHFTAHLHL